MNVKNVIISYQKEESENFKRLLEIVEQKKINLIIVSSCNKIKIENSVNICVLWPDKEKLIIENPMNNNSIVCKVCYQNFSILLTGDIEKIAEEAILRKYKENEKILESTILKVAHHGSKSSSTPKWIDRVNPKMALIGVGENNLFGHPDQEVLDRLMNKKTKIYRTDKDNKIIIKIKRGRVLVG